MPMRISMMSLGRRGFGGGRFGGRCCLRRFFPSSAAITDDEPLFLLFPHTRSSDNMTDNAGAYPTIGLEGVQGSRPR